MSDIFISYANEDRPRAEMLAQALKRRGWPTFWDRTIPTGKTWREVIGAALEEARCVVVLWSEASIDSAWVQEEADEGRERGILIPVLIEAVRPPIGFRSFQTADLSDWEGSAEAPALQRLIADIAEVIGPSPAEVACEDGEEERRQAEAEAKRKAEEQEPKDTGSQTANRRRMWIAAAAAVVLVVAAIWGVFQYNVQPLEKQGPGDSVPRGSPE
jgi:hypothetical protein